MNTILFNKFIMQIRTIYEMTHRIGQLGNSPRQYIDKKQSSNSLPVKYKKRQTFFADIQKISKNIPGPGKYQSNPQDKKHAEKVYKKIDFNEEAKKPKKSFIDEAIKRNKNLPGVGKYELINDKSEKIRQWHSIIGGRIRQKTSIFKSSIFDDCRIDCINVAPGSYNITEHIGKKNKFAIETKPIIPKSGSKKEESKKRTKSLPKLPNPQSYRPIPSQYTTFDRILSQKSIEQVKKNIEKPEKVTKLKEVNPGPKYNLIAEWSPRNKQGTNMFKSTRSIIPPSIYH